MKSPILKSFFAGDYLSLVESQVDKASLAEFSELERAYLIGALVFVGRRPDAKAEFASHLRSATLESRTIARFFLGIGACRDSEYSEARKLFCENYRGLNKLHSTEARFFVHQGLGFFRFFCSRFGKSILWSERAWRIAFEARFQYGMALSADLRGHGLLQVGKVAQGLSTLDNALKGQNEKGGVQAAMEVSIACYRAQFGLLGRASHELKKIWKGLASSDTYSRSNLTLERARALLLEGKTDLALEWLNDGAQEIFRYGHRRQKSTLLARKAHALLLQGRDSEAKAAIEEGLSLLDFVADASHRLELLGLQARLSPNQETTDLINRLTWQTGRGMARQILTRSKKSPTPAGDDPLGHLLDQLARDVENPELLLQAKQRGWLGIFNRLVEREPGIVFYLELLPGRLVVFQCGNVHVSEAVVPGNLKRLLITLAQGASSKEELVEAIWGYKYNSLRHDPMLYNSIYRLRQLLGEFEKFLIAGPEGYVWRESVKARVFERSRPACADHGAAEGHGEVSLNLRQLRALEICKVESSLTVARYSEALKVAKATATRDLAELVERGYLARIGQARATAYVSRGSS